MVTTQGAITARIRGATPQDYPVAADVHGRVRVFNETVLLAGQVIADVIEVGVLPKGARFLYGLLLASATLGAVSTIAIGAPGNAGKYRAAAIFTAVDTPTLFGSALNNSVALAAQEIVQITVGAANLPVGGTLRIQLFYSLD